MWPRTASNSQNAPHITAPKETASLLRNPTLDNETDMRAVGVTPRCYCQFAELCLSFRSTTRTSSCKHAMVPTQRCTRTVGIQQRHRAWTAPFVSKSGIHRSFFKIVLSNRLKIPIQPSNYYDILRLYLRHS